MNILIREATEIDYPAINKMLLKLQNYHSENVPTIYKKLDSFFTFDVNMNIKENKFGLKEYILEQNIEEKVLHKNY